jgi:hypothetical protein
MNEPFIIDHDNPKKIIVSDYNDFASCYEHYPLYFKGNRIYVIGVESERDYLKNRVNSRMEVYEYSYWKPIPEPKFRPMTWEEALPILSSAWIRTFVTRDYEEDKECWRKVYSIYYELNEFDICGGGRYTYNFEHFEYTYDFKEIKKFEVEVKE